MTRISGLLRQRLPRHLEDWQEEVEGLFEHLLGGNSVGFVPALNLSESATAYEVSLDLPGLKPEEVKVELHEKELLITGERQNETTEEGKSWHRVERRYGKFRRNVTLPAVVDGSKITAEFANGVLKVVLPKAQKAQAVQIQVKG